MSAQQKLEIIRSVEGSGLSVQAALARISAAFQAVKAMDPL